MPVIYILFSCLCVVELTVYCLTLCDVLLSWITTTSCLMQPLMIASCIIHLFVRMLILLYACILIIIANRVETTEYWSYGSKQFNCRTLFDDVVLMHSSVYIVRHRLCVSVCLYVTKWRCSVLKCFLMICWKQKKIYCWTSTITNLLKDVIYFKSNMKWRDYISHITHLYDWFTCVIQL